MLSFLELLLGSAALLIATLLFQQPRRRLPPGPMGLPFIGSAITLLRAKKEWLAFARWGEQYGPICSVTVMGRTFIILNKARVAFDMLNKKSSIYSDRPQLPMASHLVGWENSLPGLNDGKRFKYTRRMFGRVMGSVSALNQNRPVQDRNIKLLMKKLIETPENLRAHTRWLAGAIILELSHGYRVGYHTDPLLQLADETVTNLAYITTPGRYLVDLLPVLRHVPRFFPGAQFKRDAAVWRKRLQKMVNTPFAMVQKGMAEGTTPECMTSIFLEEKKSDQEDEQIKWGAFSAYAAGSDTTVSMGYAFYRIMVLYPEIQKKLQAEVDSVIGQDRLPGFNDRKDLPYVNAVVRELLRFHNPVPTAVPHLVNQDDVQDGYLIPAGSFVFANIWQMVRDPDVYSDPLTFRPERFLGPNPEADIWQICFGFGRRICPGLYLADANIFLIIALTVSLFDISPYVDEHGVKQMPALENTSGSTSHCVPYKADIKPRSERKAELLLSAVEEAN